MIRSAVFTFCVVVIFSVIADIKCQGVNRTKRACCPRRKQPMPADSGCECGISKVNQREAGARIINGKPVRPTFKYPWMIALYSDDTQLCGASLVSPTFVLTAAHCVADGSPEKKLNNNMCLTNGRKKLCYLEARRLKIGYMGKSNQLGNFNPVKKVIPHPQYNPASKEYDLALLELKKPVSCSGYVRPICLPKNVPEIKAATKGIAAGWGMTEKMEDSSELLEAELAIQQKPMCQKLVGGIKTHICARGRSQGVCMGDSGGPLMSVVRGKFYLFGVTSFGHSSMCETTVPQFFSNVKQSLNWIQQNMR